MFCIRKLIRRTRRPLEELTEATHRVAAGDYHSRVTPAGDEELRGLAVAFNGMTEQIGRRFETLAVLSKLDRHILKSSELEEIVQAVLKHARDMLPCELLAVLVFDENCADVARLHVARYAEEVITCETRVEVPAALGSLLDTCEPIVELQAGDAAFESVRDLISDWRADRRFGVLPIRTDKGVQGAVAIAYSTPNASDRASLDFALGLAERLAVAISTADQRQALLRQAHYDGLTSLPNRVLFKDRLAQRIANGQRRSKKFVNLYHNRDRYKDITHSFGHTPGDEVLKGV